MRATPSVANRLRFSIDTAFYAAMAGDAARSRAAIDRGLTRLSPDSMPPGTGPGTTGPARARRSGTRPGPAGARGIRARPGGDARDRRAAGRTTRPRSPWPRRWDEAVGLLHEADARTSWFSALRWLRSAGPSTGGPADSAIVYYQKFLATREASRRRSRWRARTHRWLGELYEAG